MAVPLDTEECGTNDSINSAQEREPCCELGSVAPTQLDLGGLFGLVCLFSSLRWRDCDNVERGQVALISSHAVPLPSLLALYLRRRDRYRSGRHRADARKQQSACMTAQV